MASTYSGNLSPYDKPAKIETNPLSPYTGGGGTGIYTFDNLDVLTVIVGDGTSFVTSSFTFNVPNNLFGTTDALVAFLNTNLIGVAPFDFEWYNPGIETLSKNGVLSKKTFGVRIGVRTKSLVGNKATISIPSCTALGGEKINIVPTTNRGEAGFTQVLSQPSPFDPFIALSVNFYQKGLRDRDFSILNSIKFNMDQSNPMIAESTDLASITVRNIPNTVQTNGKPIFLSKLDTTVLTVANKGGTFANTTWYYVYNYYNVITNQVTYEISTVAPTNNGLFKTGDQTRRYMFSFVTDGVAAIRPFFRVANNHTYYPSLPILNNGNAIVATPLTMAFLVPPRANVAKLHSTFTVASGVVRQFNLWPSTFTGTPTWIGTCDTNNVQENSFLMPIASQAVDYKIDNALDNLSLFVEGFIE